MATDETQILYNAHDNTGVHCDVLKLSLQKKKAVNTNDIARMVAPKGAQMLYNLLSIGPRIVLRSAFQLLRANIVTRLISVVVLVVFDTWNLWKGRISKKQFIINVTLAAMLLVGGTVGWTFGGRVASIVLDNMILGFIASLIGAGIVGAGLGAIVEKAIKRFVKSDDEDMLEICNTVFADMAKDNLLNESEIEAVKEELEITKPILKNMFAQKDKIGFVQNLLAPCISSTIDIRNDCCNEEATSETKVTARDMLSPQSFKNKPV